MKASLSALLVSAALTTAVASAAGCYGSYGAFNRVHDWNGHVTGDKIANSAVHLALWIIPVYPLCLVGDFLIFNTIEFATGTNPLK
jgi:hypothetical protein